MNTRGKMKLNINPYHLLIIAVVLLFFLVLLQNSWLVDDAYITFRTVDNFVKGYGLTWNTGERVQVYTHPLWMFVISFFYLFTSEIFFTVIILSAFLTIAASVIAGIMVTSNFKESPWKFPLLILAFMCSKAVIDYASSGLENPLSYLFMAIFLFKFISIRFDTQKTDLKAVGLLFLLASLAFLNRADTLIIYIPALIYLLYISKPKKQLVPMVLLAISPAILWLLFSLIYYGYIFPNTAYAKVFTPDFPFSWKVLRGLEYLKNSVKWDRATYIILAMTAWFTFRKKSLKNFIMLIGIGLYIVFVVCSGAAATHMSGRFFALPFFTGIILFIYGIPKLRWGGIITYVCVVAYIALFPISSVKFGTSAYHVYGQKSSCIDTKWYVWQEGASLLNWRPGKKMPDHDWYHYGEMFRQRPEKVHIGGAFGGDAIGYVGFAAGPEKYLIDIVALGDPLLSRLPAIKPSSIDNWKSGHFHRDIPSGYCESLLTEKNLIQNPKIHQYYDKVRIITRDPVFNWNRFRVILNMNLGKYQFLLNNNIVEK